MDDRHPALFRCVFRRIAADLMPRILIYDVCHRRTRARLDPVVSAGGSVCCLCGKGIDAGTPWDLAHSDDRTRWLGPSHAACNRGDAGRKTARLRWEQGVRRTSRAW
jgi:hypothetical protein